MEPEEYLNAATDLLISYGLDSPTACFEVASTNMGIAFGALSAASNMTGSSRLTSEEMHMATSKIGRGVIWLGVPALAEEDDENELCRLFDGLQALIWRKQAENPDINKDAVVGAGFSFFLTLLAAKRLNDLGVAAPTNEQILEHCAPITEELLPTVYRLLHEHKPSEE